MLPDESYASFSSHVANSLKKIIKNVQVTGDFVDDEDLEEAVDFDLVGVLIVVPHSP